MRACRGAGAVQALAALLQQTSQAPAAPPPSYIAPVAAAAPSLLRGMGQGQGMAPGAGMGGMGGGAGMGAAGMGGGYMGQVRRELCRLSWLQALFAASSCWVRSRG